MATPVLIIGDSGSGKSTSARSLPAEQTFYINVQNKPLPFKGWKKNYTQRNAENPTGNYYATDNAGKIEKILKDISENSPEIKYIVIDDYQYTMANEYMRRAKERGFDKFTEIAQHAWSIANTTTQLREDLKIFILTHAEDIIDATGAKKRKAKTIGKMMDNVITLEGLFFIVLFADSEVGEDNEINHFFLTQNDGSNTAKSPSGMFDNIKIPNDLLKVAEAIEKFEN